MDSIKIVLVGEGAVGKTSLACLAATGAYPDEYTPTVWDNSVFTFHDDNGKIVSIDLWDTAGGHDFDRLRPLHYPGCRVFLLAFSITRPESTLKLASVYMREFAQIMEGVPVVLVGCKSDLRNNQDTLDQLQSHGQQPVSYEEGEKLAKTIGAVAYVECSSKLQIGVRDVFLTALRAVRGECRSMTKRNTTGGATLSKCALM